MPSEGAKPLLTSEEYERIRSIIEHEDDLVNQRVTWLILGQTIMFIAYATILDHSPQNAHHGPPLLLRILGFATTVCACLSTLAALNNISYLDRRYRDRVPTDWPSLVAGGGLHEIGHMAPFVLYFGMTVAWIFWD